MSEPTTKPKGALGRAVGHFTMIFVVLLVPVIMDQSDVNPDTVRLVGRIAAGLTLLMLAYSLFSKALKVVGFLLLILLGLVLAMSEGHLKFPRLKQAVSSGK